MAFTVLVLHGPNLPLKGQAEIDERLEARAVELGVTLEIAQANGESGLIDALLARRETVQAVLVNAGVLAPTAVALAETLTLSKLPAVEVCEAATSALASSVRQQVSVAGAAGYLQALEALAAHAPKEEEPASEEVEEAPRRRSLGRRGEAPPQSRAGKTIGRRAAEPAAEAAEPESRQGKTIGRARDDAAPAAAPRSPAGLLTRAQVKQQITQRIKGALTAEQLAAWSRERWSGLQNGDDCEPGFRETLDTVLLTLMAGAKVNEHMLLAQIAKLDR